ncbi:MAG: RsmD family RNA methyltransferase [Solirubrobacterales bacterium]
MRVVAGELKGRRLASPPRRAADVRPTSDRARETLFALLGDVSGARVLDLYAGTGALAIEALSRGADGAVLVDSDPRLAHRNISELGLEDRCEVVRSDALRYLAGADETFDLALCDPPYALGVKLGPELGRLVPPRLEPDGRLVVESSARAPVDLDLPQVAERRIGEALIRIWAAR